MINVIKKFLNKLFEPYKFNKKVFSSSRADEISTVKQKLEQEQIPCQMELIKMGTDQQDRPLMTLKVKTEDMEKVRRIIQNK
jgi:hypothetical protein